MSKKKTTNKSERLCDDWHIGDEVYMLSAECNGAARNFQIQKGTVFGIFRDEMQVICDDVSKYVPYDCAHHSLDALRNRIIEGLDMAISNFIQKQNIKAVKRLKN